MKMKTIMYPRTNSVCKFPVATVSLRDVAIKYSILYIKAEMSLIIFRFKQI